MSHFNNIEATLDAFCRNATEKASRVDERYADLWRNIHQYVMTGGKRVRPQLILLAHNAYKSNDEIDIVPIAAAWELLHSCLLVHDDIIDRDTMRHGSPNIAGRYEAIYGELTTSDVSHYALSASLIAGDLLLMSAYEMIDTADINSDQKLLVHSYLNRAIFTVAGGQLIDTDAALYPINKSNPYSIATHKTANYSLQMPLQCGAALAGAPSDELEKFSQIGLHVGVAYQLQDDLLGVFGDSATTGKSNRSDIIEKKRTLLVHKAIENLGAPQVERLTHLLSPGHAPTPKEAEEVVDLIAMSGAKQAVESNIAAEITRALHAIDTLSISPNHKEELTQLVNKIASRKS